MRTTRLESYSGRGENLKRRLGSFIRQSKHNQITPRLITPWARSSNNKGNCPTLPPHFAKRSACNPILLAPTPRWPLSFASLATLLARPSRPPRHPKLQRNTIVFRELHSP